MIQKHPHRHLDPAVVYAGCSTTKKSYEQAFSQDKLRSIPEYRKISEQMRDLEKRFPGIRQQTEALIT